MVFQDPMATRNPLRTVGSQLIEVMSIHRTGTRRDRRRRMLEALEQARVPEPEQRAAQYPHQLSAGLRQRVMLAMALMSRPRLLIADEPTTALDVTTQAEILDLLRTLQAETGMGILLITHDLGVVASVADRVAVMHAGALVEQGDVLQVFEELRAEYTRNLLAATPRLEMGTPALSFDPPRFCDRMGPQKADDVHRRKDDHPGASVNPRQRWQDLPPSPPLHPGADRRGPQKSPRRRDPRPGGRVRFRQDHYELGARSSWLDDRLAISGALFLNDMRKEQMQTWDYEDFTGKNLQLDARSAGLE